MNEIKLKEPLAEHSTTQKDPPPALKTFPEILKEQRKEKKWTQEDLAKRASLSTMQISRLESGKHLPTIPTLVKLGPFLGYSLDELLLSSSYSGAVPTRTPTYVDFSGRKIDPGEIGMEMYHKDGELFLKIYDFYQSISPENSEFLKIVLEQLKAEIKQGASAEKASVSDSSDKQKYFSEMFRHLKALLTTVGEAYENN